MINLYIQISIKLNQLVYVIYHSLIKIIICINYSDFLMNYMDFFDIQILENFLCNDKLSLGL